MSEPRPGRIISARIVTVEELFRLGRFRPASVQRDYQWREANCRTLLADLRRVLDPDEHEPAGEAPAPVQKDDAPIADAIVPAEQAASERPVASYYLGNIIVRPDAAGVLEVYDGLQRLATLTILISTLRDHTAKPALADRLDSLVRASSTSWRLSLRIGAHILTQEVQARGETRRRRMPRESLTETEERIREATHYFKSQIGHWTSGQIDGFATRLLELASVGVTEVEDERVARQIFVSTNLHGVRLNRVDLLKGQLMEIAPETDGDRIAAVWARLNNELGMDLDNFLEAIDFIERRKPQGVDCLTSLAAHLERYPPRGGIRGWVERLEGFAKAWSELHDRIDRLGREPTDIDIWKLRFFWWSEWKPLALLWYRDYMDRRGPDGRVPAATRGAFERRFAALHGRCLAIILAGYEPTERARIFANAIRQTRNGENPLTGALAFDRNSLDKMRQALLVPLTDNDKRHATIRWIEASLWPGAPPAHIGEATVEHVLPQRAAATSRWREDFPDDEARYDAAHSLGNLALLDWSRNQRLSNADYHLKRSAYLQAPEFKTLADVAERERWTIEAIRARERRLAEYVFAALQLPEFARARPG